MYWAVSLEPNLERTLHYVGEAARAGSRVVLFPEANLTSYYFPYLVELDPERVQSALDACAPPRNSTTCGSSPGPSERPRDRF